MTNEFKSILRKDGKLTVPLAVRKAMDLKVGDILTIRIDGTIRPKPVEAK